MELLYSRVDENLIIVKFKVTDPRPRSICLSYKSRFAVSLIARQHAIAAFNFQVSASARRKRRSVREIIAVVGNPYVKTYVKNVMSGRKGRRRWAGVDWESRGEKHRKALGAKR
jgi:hypothetical protein